MRNVKQQILYCFPTLRVVKRRYRMKSMNFGRAGFVHLVGFTRPIGRYATQVVTNFLNVMLTSRLGRISCSSSSLESLLRPKRDWTSFSTTNLHIVDIHHLISICQQPAL